MQETERRTLLDLLTTSLVLHQLAPYIPVPSRLALAATCQSYRQILYGDPSAWRHLDLSFARDAALDTSPIDRGGISWRAERMDESMTEDDFYAGPLRGIFSQLERHGLLRHAQTLILDGLSVPADLVNEILISQDRFNVKVLSVRGATHLNESKLMHSIRYAVRPSRTRNPKIQAIYFFSPQDQDAEVRSRIVRNQGITDVEGAKIGSFSEDDATNCSPHTWYQPAGKVVKTSLTKDWAEVIQICDGLIAFDAVLCRGPRHSIEHLQMLGENVAEMFLPAQLATVALGPHGCQKCHSIDEGAVTYCGAAVSELPLLSPPLLHSNDVSRNQRPQLSLGSSLPAFYARCEDCLRNRRCERCNKFWCNTCYPDVTVGRTEEVRISPDPYSSINNVPIYMGLCTSSCLPSESMTGAGSNGMWG